MMENHTFTIPSNRFPLPLAPDLFSTVNLQSDIAMNTATGHVLVPHSCTGKNPTICTTGPLFQSNKYPCERALITKDEHLKAKCNISIFPSQDPILKEIGPGSYMFYQHTIPKFIKIVLGRPQANKHYKMASSICISTSHV